MKYAIGALVTLAVLAAVFLIVIFTGAYNVAATQPHTGFTEWALSTLQESSVAARAGGIEKPELDSAEVQEGFVHFDAMCVTCHGAPGVERGEIGQGITPEPPELGEEVHEWSEAELFWITKHGIKLAGMPAFGPTHDDRTLWGIVDFMTRLEGMTEEEYAAWRERAAADTAATHTHPDGSTHTH